MRARFEQLRERLNEFESRYPSTYFITLLVVVDGIAYVLLEIGRHA
jgi:hypothetical protein